MPLSKKESMVMITPWRDSKGIQDRIESIMEDTGANGTDTKKHLIRLGLDQYGKEVKPKKEAKPKGFVKPTPEELVKYFKSKGSDKSEAEKFFNFYESKGWKVGKTPMKSWPHSVSNWLSNNKSPSSGKGSTPDRSAIIAKVTGRQQGDFIEGECYEHE